MNIGNSIYVSNNSNAREFNIENSKLIKIDDKNFQKDRIYSNGKYICIRNPFDVNIYSLNMKLINIIIHQSSQSLLIDDDDKILISSNDKFCIYDLKGTLLKSWSLDDNSNKQIRGRRMSIYKNEIYVADTSFNRVCVFSYEGELLRSWGDEGKKLGNFRNPWGITIYKNIVFVVDFLNNKIQTFTCYGKFIYEYTFENNTTYSEIIIIDDYIYLIDWKSPIMIKLKLTFN
jgi:hypothetical protein